MPGHQGSIRPAGDCILLCDDLGKRLRAALSVVAALTMPEFLPDRHEAGTHNVTGICGLKKGIEFVLEKTPAAILKHEQKLITLAGENWPKLGGSTASLAPIWCRRESCHLPWTAMTARRLGSILPIMALLSERDCTVPRWLTKRGNYTDRNGPVSVGAFNRKRDMFRPGPVPATVPVSLPHTLERLLILSCYYAGECYNYA